jgi:large subunit ribosomal protein L25
MERVKLVVHPRSESGTRAVKRLRKQGLIPGVLYGAGKPAAALSVDERELRAAVSTEAGLHAVLDITFEGQKTAHVAVLKEYQLDNVRHVVTHVDFHEVKLTEPIEAKVTVAIEGECAGVKMGGILDVLLREITARALPTHMPDHVTLDVTDLEMGDVAHVRDLVVPEDITVLDDPDDAVCTVLVPRKVVEVEAELEEGEEEEEGEAAAEEPTEPEVVGSPKRDEGGAAE